MPRNIFAYDSVELSSNEREVVILDQTLLPNQEKFLNLSTPEQIFFAITLHKVQGASAVSLVAAFGLAVCVNRYKARNITSLEKEFLRIKRYLYISRPAAVTLMKVLDRMESRFYAAISEFDVNDKEAISSVKAALIMEAKNIKLEDADKCRAISEEGLKLLVRGSRILTCSNAGHLSVARFGTALGPVYLAQKKGFAPKVYVCETRPLLQGSRLAAYELVRNGVETVLICDNAAATVMDQGRVDCVFVGCSRIFANGDVVSTVGTAQLAVLAKHYGIPFYVLAPSSAIDSDNYNQKAAEEESGSYEVTDTYFNKPSAPDGIKVYNPSFDVTRASLISGIITEKGLFSPKGLKSLIRND